MALIQKAFSDIITFSRSSNATRVGPTGLVEYAPHNLQVRSQEFENAIWTKAGASITANATAAPDGTVTSDKLVEDSSSGGHQTYQIGLTVVAQSYTASVYAKAAERTYIWLALFNGTTNGGVYFNLANGTAGSLGTDVTAASITPAGNGWYRCSITRTMVASANAGINIQLADSTPSISYVGNGSSGVFIWGAQLSVGPYALDYTPTTSAAVYGPRFDYDGSGVTSVDPIARNLLTYSEQFDNGAWFKGLATITSNALSAPDGTVTADLATAGAGTGVSEISGQISSGTFANNSVVTFSVYFKAGTKDSVTLSYNVASGNYAVAVFDLSGVSVSQTAQLGTFVLNGSSITSVGSGWFRCSISFTSSNFSATTNVPFVGIAPAKTGNTFNSNGRISATYAGTETVYLWGAQVEVGSTATGYMVSGATNGFRAVPVVTGNATARGLLVEEQRTNVLTYSEQFDNAVWTKTRSSVTANSTAAPDGTVTADKLVEDTTATNSHTLRQTLTIAAVPHTFTVYAKAAERSWVRIVDASITNGGAYFNLGAGTLGTIGANATASIISVGNGWYRCSITVTTTSTGDSFDIRLANADGGDFYTGDGVSGLYLWGAQLEAGAFATSYIPTVASTVTRSADVASVNTLSPWFNATEGTLFAEWDFAGYSSFNPVIDIGTDQNNIMTLSVNSSVVPRFTVVSGGVTQANLTLGSAASPNTTYKHVGAYKENDFAACLNGGTVATDTSGTVPAATQATLGGTIALTRALNGHLRRIAVYPRRLTNVELQALTA